MGTSPRGVVGPAHSLRLAILFAAITGCFLVYSLVQERLMTLGFGPGGERFQHSLLVILVNRLVACAVSAAALALLGKPLRPAAPLAHFAVPSLANVVSSCSQYEALKYVSFPLQALAKCAKTVPVMVWGLALGGRKYSRLDYGCALAITLGCALFVLTGSIAAPRLALPAAAAAAATTGAGGSAAALAAAAAGGGGAWPGGSHWLLYGLALLAAFLVFDGLTSTTQDKLFCQHGDMHSCNQLLWVSGWSGGASLVLLLATAQLWPALAFVARHPVCLAYILLLSLLSTAVQLFIFYTIQQYGALHFALMMTMRQFLSIVLSCLVFSHELTASQWLGTSFVMGGLLTRGMYRDGNGVGGGGWSSSHAALAAQATLKCFPSGASAMLLPLVAPKPAAAALLHQPPPQQQQMHQQQSQGDLLEPESPTPSDSLFKKSGSGGSIVAVDVTAAGSGELWSHQREGQPLLRSPGRGASGDTTTASTASSSMAAMALGLRRKAGEAMSV